MSTSDDEQEYNGEYAIGSIMSDDIHRNDKSSESVDDDVESIADFYDDETDGLPSSNFFR